jgi:hypothetical protein
MGSVFSDFAEVLQSSERPLLLAKGGPSSWAQSPLEIRSAISGRKSRALRTFGILALHRRHLLFSFYPLYCSS